MKTLSCLVVLLLLSSCALDRSSLINSGVVVTAPNTNSGSGTSSGSGIIIELANEKLVLTVGHLFKDDNVVDATILWAGEDQISRENPFGYTKIPAEVIMRDADLDLALLRPLERLSNRLSTLSIAPSSTSLIPGDRIIVISAPGTAPPMLTEGAFIVRLIDSSTGIPFIMVSAEVSGGSSGGGVIYGGKLVGIVVSTDYAFYRVLNTPYQIGIKARIDFITLAVPLDLILGFLEEAKKKIMESQ